MSHIRVITGTDTGAGKTVLTALLAARARELGIVVVALKPLCSGGRADALALHRALGGVLTLDEVNPWHFHAPLAPWQAARREGRRVLLSQVVEHVRKMARRFELVLVESAGGLLSPLGEGFSTLELIMALKADVVIAARSQLGVVNHVRLTLGALPPMAEARARVVLMSPPRADLVSRSNAALVGEFVRADQVTVLPWFQSPAAVKKNLARRPVQRVIDSLLKARNSSA